MRGRFRFFRLFPVVGLIAWGVMAGGGQAEASSLTWHIKSEYDYIVHLKFFNATDRRGVWPGGGNVWVLDDSKTHTYNLECDYGDKVCYGAWPAGNSSTYWGVGRWGEESCTSCCMVCNGGEGQPIRLK